MQAGGLSRALLALVLLGGCTSSGSRSRSDNVAEYFPVTLSEACAAVDASLETLGFVSEDIHWSAIESRYSGAIVLENRKLVGPSLWVLVTSIPGSGTAMSKVSVHYRAMDSSKDRERASEILQSIATVLSQD